MAAHNTIRQMLLLLSCGILICFLGGTAFAAAKRRGVLASMVHVNVELVQLNGRPHLRITGHVIAEKFLGVTDVSLERTGPFELTVSVFGKTHFLAAGKASRRYTEAVKRGQPLFKKPIDHALAYEDLETFRKRHADFIADQESWRGPIVFDKLFPVSDYPHGKYRVFVRRGKDGSEFLKELEL